MDLKKKYAKKCEIVLHHALGMKIVKISVLNNTLSVKIVPLYPHLGYSFHHHEGGGGSGLEFRIGVL